MTLPTDRKEELYRIIDHLENVKLWDDLTLDELNDLDDAETELASIVAKEKTMKEAKAQETKMARKRVNKRWKRSEDWWRKYLEPDGWKQEGHMKRGLSCPDWRKPEMFVLDEEIHKISKHIEAKYQKIKRLYAKQGEIPILSIYDPEKKIRRLFIDPLDFIDLCVGDREAKNESNL